MLIALQRWQLSDGATEVPEQIVRKWPENGRAGFVQRENALAGVHLDSAR
jgi:hypothetical protein